PDARRRRLQVRAADLDQGRVENARVLAEFLGRVEERALANVVAADDEVRRIGQAEPFEEGQGGDQAPRGRCASRESRKAEGDRGADAAKGSHQPKADTSVAHA